MTDPEMTLAGQMQRRLEQAGFDPGPIDGKAGPRTYAALFSYVAGHDLGMVGRDLGVGAAAHLPEYGVVTPLRIAHFLGQTAHETMGFRYLREIWGPTDAQARYQGRVDLGNTQPGDGKRFLGRGILQITGRSNYAAVGKRLRMDLIGQPELAERPDCAVLIACDYWRMRDINTLADRDSVEAVTRAINGGLNGLDERRELTQRAKVVLL